MKVLHTIKLSHLVAFNMTVPRIFCNSNLSVQDRLELPPDAARHVQVLRLQPGSALTLFNGEGGEFESEILEMTRKDVIVKVIAFKPIERESTLAVHLAIGMPANERMDWLVEKSTELGLNKLTPLMTQHNVVRLNQERGDKKLIHWNSIASAACSQCGRNRAPLIDTPTSLTPWLKSLPNSDPNLSLRWFFSLEEGAAPLHNQFERVSSLLTKPARSVLIAFGPEGGWSAQEELLLKDHSFVPLSLGERTLRAETAAIATLAALTLLF